MATYLNKADRPLKPFAFNAKVLEVQIWREARRSRRQDMTRPPATTFIQRIYTRPKPRWWYEKNRYHRAQALPQTGSGNWLGRLAPESPLTLHRIDIPRSPFTDGT